MSVYKSDEKLNIREEDIETGGHYGSESFDMSIPATIGWHDFDKTWPHPVSLLEAQILIESSNVGDLVKAKINPDTTVGVLSAQMDSGSKTATFTVPDSLFVGMAIEIDGNDLGYITSIEDDLTSLETSIAAPSNIAATTLVKVTVLMARHIKLPTSNRYTVGASKIGGSYLPAGTVLRVSYYNQVATAKDFSVFLEYLY